MEAKQVKEEVTTLVDHYDKEKKQIKTTTVINKTTGEEKYTSYYLSGIKRSVFELINNTMDGKAVEYYDSGEVMKETYYVKGLIKGAVKEWYKNGNVKSICECYMENGKCEKYYETGELLSQALVIDGKLDSMLEYYYKNGGIKFVHMMENGRCIRVEKAIDEKGRNNVLAKGAVLAWKACKSKGENVYVKVLIPKEARRVTSPSTNVFKSRAEYVKVVSIEDSKGNAYEKAESFVYKEKTITYEVGKEVHCDMFNSDSNEECGGGIHVHAYQDQCDQWFS